MTLLFGIVGKSILDMLIYFACSIIVFIAVLFQLNRHREDLGIPHLFALLCWIASMISLSFVKYPINKDSVAFTLAIIFACSWLSLVIIPALYIFFRDFPKKIKKRRENRQERRKKVAMKEHERKNNIFDL
jgi:Ca2+/Na+ antiporter